MATALGLVPRCATRAESSTPQQANKNSRSPRLHDAGWCLVFGALSGTTCTTQKTVRSCILLGTMWSLYHMMAKATDLCLAAQSVRASQPSCFHQTRSCWQWRKEQRKLSYQYMTCRRGSAGNSYWQQMLGPRYVACLALQDTSAVLILPAIQE